MNASDAVNLIAQGVTTLIAVGAALYALWKFFLQKPIAVMTHLFQRVDTLEANHTEIKNKIDSVEVVSRDAFKDMREAITEEGEGIRALVTDTKNATVTRLDRLNGKIAEHEGKLSEHTITLAKMQAAEEAERRVFADLQATARLAGRPLTIGNPPPEPDIPTDLSQLG